MPSSLDRLRVRVKKIHNLLMVGKPKKLEHVYRVIGGIHGEVFIAENSRVKPLIRVYQISWGKTILNTKLMRTI